MQQMTDKTSGGLSSFKVKQKRAWLGALTAAAFAASGISALAGSATFDFSSDPTADPNFIFGGNNFQPWQPTSGNPGGFLAVTYAEGSQDTIVVFPDIDGGKLVKAFTFEADLRVGNGSTDRPADGFSINYVRGNDPILQNNPPSNADFATGGAVETGARTGITVSFDTWAGNTLPDGADIEGIIVRVDNVTVNRTALPTRHGACDDITSLQTGVHDIAYFNNGGDPHLPEAWATLCWQPFSMALDENGKLTVTWKGNKILDAFQTTYFPSVGRIVLAGRTGGANEATHLDNIRLTTVLADSPIVGLPQGDGCGFTIPIADAGPISPTQSTIKMTLDGADVTPSISKVGDVTTLQYSAPSGMPLASGSTHSIVVSFTDTNSKVTSQARSYTVPAYSTIPATAVASTFDASSSGFKVRVNQQEFGRGPGDANLMVNAEQQLSGGYFTPAGLFSTATGAPAANVAFPAGTPDGFYTTLLVNWEQNFGSAGNFQFGASDPAYQIQDEFIPGIPGITDSTDNIAAEILTFLELKKGCYRFGVNSDDGFAVRLGFGATSSVLTGGIFNGGRGSADSQFPVYVEADGVYPIRLSWWEGGGGANVEFFTVDSTGARHLINNRSDPMAVKAYSVGTTKGYLADINPYPGYLGAEPKPVISATFVNGSTSVDTASIKMWVDGQPVTVSPTTSGSKVTASYTPATAFKFGSAHTTTVAYSIGGVGATNTYNFTVRTLQLRDLGTGGLPIEAEHFDYDGGQSIPAVSTPPYDGIEYDSLGAVNNVDYAQDGNETSNDAYRLGEDPNVPMDSQLTLNDLDTQRPGFEVFTNYKIGWGAAGDWYNYTRTFTAGNYKIIGAESHGDAAGTADRQVARFGVVLTGKGTANQTTVDLGSYSTPSSGGWGNNVLSVAQLAGNDAVLKIPAGQQTIRVWITSGDFDWFAFVPTTDPVSPLTASISPNTTGISALPFLATITDFWRSGTVDMNSVKLTVNGTDVSSSATVAKTTTGATVSYKPSALGPVAYTLVYKDSSGNSYTNSGSYTSVFSPDVFDIEAEDLNYDGGQTKAAASVMPLQAGLYNGLGAVHDVDYHDDANEPSSDLYRLGESPNIPMDSVPGNVNRGAFVLSQDYKLGWIGNNEWYNYTRTFPNKSFRVYAAISHGDVGPTSGSLDLVTGDVSTMNQTTAQVGIFNWPNGTGGWGANRLVPMTDAGGNILSVPMNGTQTVRYRATSGDFDYLLFIPGAAVMVGQDVTSPNDTIVGFGGRWPDGENPTNAFNNTSLKYLNFGGNDGASGSTFKGPVGVTVTPAKGSSVVTGIRFYTANDVEGRDPADYVLEGSNDGGATFTQISAGALALPSTRTQPNQNMLNGPRQEVTFANTTAYTTYKISFNSTKSANIMQIGEIELLGTASGTPAGPRLTVSRSGNNVTVTWTGGTLEWSMTVGSGYTAVPGATGGTFTTAISGKALFFRAKQ